MRTNNIPPCYRKIKEILIMPLLLCLCYALLSTLNGSNYPCLKLIFMVTKVFEPLKFDCSYTIVCPPVGEIIHELKARGIFHIKADKLCYNQYIHFISA